MTQRPSQQDVATFVRRFLDTHSTWDGPHQFVSVTWDGVRLQPGTIAIIDPSIHPDAYPPLMASLAEDMLKDTSDPVVAFALQIEAHLVIAPTAPTPQQAAEFARDRRERRFHQRPDAVEIATVYCVDVTGRTWTAQKRRDQPGGAVEEHAYPDGESRLGGQFLAALDRVASLAAARAG